LENAEAANARADVGIDKNLNWSQIYAEHRAALWSFAQRLIGDPVGAEDLVHDVFVALPKLIKKVTPGTPLRSYLLGVVANRARNHFRASRRRSALAHAWEQEATAQSGDCPERSAERTRLAARLQRGMDTLSIQHRVVFVLCEVEGYSGAEVSEILNLPPGTVRSRLFHAKQQLQAHLDAEANRDRS
jgi:RNA polymerase sigma-70 factor (ECF subfamily)